MNKIAQFEKVSYDCFAAGFSGEDPRGAYDRIVLPKRATTGSAGYDFYLTRDICLKPSETVLIPTGIRARMDEGWVLMLFPRSGLGFKFRLQLNNTVGIIDSDYYFSKNEGHIFCKITNDSKEEKTLVLKEGEAFCQGIFLPFGLTVDDNAEGIRDGGFGSTDKK